MWKGVKGENKKMRINKEYNIEKIIKEVERCIEVTRQKIVNIDILTAQAVVDILKTISENGSEATKNGMELHSKTDKNGNILRSLENTEKESAAKCYGNYDDDMACMLCELEKDCRECTEKGILKKPHCFGKYTTNCQMLYKKEPCEYIDDCRVEKENRLDVEECEKKKERNETLCDDCLMSCCCNADCTNEHITKQMLGDLTKCFGKSFGKGQYIIKCGTCKYAEQCEVLTKHE